MSTASPPPDAPIGGQFRDRINRCAADLGGPSVLADRAGVSRAAVSKYGAGAAEPGLRALVKLAQAANVDLEWLATGRGAPRPISPSSNGPGHLDLLIRTRVTALLDELLSSPRARELQEALAQEQIDALRRGERDALPSEMAALIRFAPASWLFSSTSFVETPQQLVRSARGSGSEALLQIIHAEKLSRELRADLEAVMRTDFISHRVTSEAMAPKVRPGDIVIADPGATIESNNFSTFLIQDGAHIFVGYASLDQARGSVRISFENERIPPFEKRVIGERPEISIIGKVVKKISIGDLPLST